MKTKSLMAGLSRWLVCAAVLMTLASCEKALMPADEEGTPTTVFESLWEQTDRLYSMFDVKGVDWQAVHDTLVPQVTDSMDDARLFQVCAAMLSTLHDGHVNLYSSHDISHSDSIYYRFYAESQIDVNAVVLGYLGAGYHTTGGVAHQGIDSGRVAYLRYSSFSNGITAGQLRHILDSYPQAEGLILDIRGNGGGAIDNIYNILSVLPSHGQHLYSSQIKTGPGHADFSSPTPTYAPDIADSLSFHHRVVVLTDRGCYSAASMFALCCRAYPEVILLGDTTGGGLGLPTMGMLPNGWRYRLPVTRLLSPEGSNFENGVPPHRRVALDREMALRHHRDNLIDSAIAIIRQ